MAWIEDLHGKIVGVDTAPFIYLIEENPKYVEAMRRFFSAVDSRQIQIVTSTVTLLEVLVQPIRRGQEAFASHYREILLDSTNMSCQAVSSGIAEEAARLRATYNIHTPDSIQLATAIREGASHFLTNDRYLPSIASPELLILDQLPGP